MVVGGGVMVLPGAEAEPVGDEPPPPPPGDVGEGPLVPAVVELELELVK